MVYFTDILPTEHYLEEHEYELSLELIAEIILSTKNPRRKGDVFEIDERGYYILFSIKNNIAYIINAKRK